MAFCINLFTSTGYISVHTIILFTICYSLFNPLTCKRQKTGFVFCINASLLINARIVKQAQTLLGYAYYCFTHCKISVLINKAYKSCFLYDCPKFFILFNFHSFSMILTTHGHKNARTWLSFILWGYTWLHDAPDVILHQID